jgi:hypothetical protein
VVAGGAADDGVGSGRFVVLVELLSEPHAAMVTAPMISGAIQW